MNEITYTDTMTRECQQCGHSFRPSNTQVKKGFGLFCSRRCAGINKSDRQVPKFWESLDRTSGCWVWTGGLARGGYGQTVIHGQKTTSHRAAWMLTFGPIPSGMHVCHHCDNPACCNPDHLFLGTNQDNTADRQRKGRDAKGEKHGNAVVGDPVVEEARNLYATGRLTQRELARRYGISQATIWRWVNGIVRNHA